jgi:sugar/nucleoside kinase (ribokinase family)
MTGWPQFSSELLDLVGVGAINVDRILTTEQARRIDDFSMEGGSERLVSDERMDDHLRGAAASPTEHLGGSTFNVVRALTHMGLPVRLGFLGVEGMKNNQQLTSRRRLAELGVDVSSIVPIPEMRRGTCLSEPDRDGRRLLTSCYANAAMGSLLAADLDTAARYCARARIVHVTSFLDETTLRQICRLLVRVRELAPQVLICIDPGYVWCKWATSDNGAANEASRSATVWRILAQADYLLLNEPEFNRLSTRLSGSEDKRDLASTILSRCRDSWPPEQRTARTARAVVVLKRAGSSELFHGAPHMVDRISLDEVQLAEADVADDTGAGDVFAAGFLAGLWKTETEPARFGARLGARLARVKLRHVGDAAYPEIAPAANRVLSAVDELDDITDVTRLHRVMHSSPEDSETVDALVRILRRFPRTLVDPPSESSCRNVPRFPLPSEMEEADVQALVFRFLRGIFDEVACEAPDRRRAGRAPRLDLLLRQQRVGIELKRVSPSASSREIYDQLIIDIDRYKICSALIALVWDPRERIAEPGEYERELDRQEPLLVRAVVLQPGFSGR